MGVELKKPIVSETAREAGFTNERALEGKIRFLKNLAGLWLVQQVRADLQAKGESYSYEELTRLASEAKAFKTLIDPAYSPFAQPGEMLLKIERYAEQTNQPLPTTPGEFVRSCLESLALAYRDTLQKLQALTGQIISTIHIVGGGGKNELLSRMTAYACGVKVVVGPHEATAIGNALTQAIGNKDVKDQAELRAIVRNSFELTTILPTDGSEMSGFDWEKQAERFGHICEQSPSDLE